MRRRLRKLRQQCQQRRRAAFFVLQQSQDQEPAEHFVDPAARLHDEMVAALPPLPAHRARRYRDQLEFWPTRQEAALALA